MNKKIIKISLVVILLILMNVFHIYLPCMFHKITNLYCPGCGLTRMLIAISKGNFYQAFRYNMLLFILFPIFMFFIIDYIYKSLIKKRPLYQKIPDKVYVVIIIILMLFAILRNIFPVLAPTTI